MNKQEHGRDVNPPAQHTDNAAGKQPQSGQDEMQTSYDGPLDKVEGNTNNGETGLGLNEQNQESRSA